MTSHPEATTKYRVVRDISLGERVAEDERDGLASYFVETEQWRRVWNGDVDVVFAPKGGGKSAIYSMLTSKFEDLFDRGILLAAAENPTGNTVFSEIKTDPPTSEREFVGIWKLYFLALVAEVFHDYDLKVRTAVELVDRVRDAGLLVGSKAKRRLIKQAMYLVRRALNPSSVEGTIALDPSGNMTAVTGKIVFQEPSAIERDSGAVHIDELLELADSALDEEDFAIWIVLDRLDVAFADSRDLEENALRALFRVYRDVQALKRLALKIFLRSDIWKSITENGFREASHVTRELNIQWSEATLLQLVVRRLLQSDQFLRFYSVDASSVLNRVELQQELFYRVYPDQVDRGSQRSRTFDWCLSRTRDGHGRTAPRELIHLLSEARGQQLRRFEVGEEPPIAEELFDSQALRSALPEVSKVRLTKTLYAEYPTLKVALQRLEGQKTLQNKASLAIIWELDEGMAGKQADRLVEIGFFERRGGPQAPTYWVPFLYRPALNMIQGSADGVQPLEND